MRIPIPVVVYAQWVFIAILAAALIAFSFWKGLSGEKTLVFWRRIKLYSALLGVVGILLLMVRIDTDTRAHFTGEARNLLLLEFIDAKTSMAVSMANLCAIQTPPGEVLHSRENTCWDIKNIDAQLSVLNIRDMKQFQLIKNWQNNPVIAGVVSDINYRIESMNRLIPPAEDRFILFGDDTRLGLLFWASVLLVLAVSGSVGEAAYHYQDALARTAPALKNLLDAPTPITPNDPTNPISAPCDVTTLPKGKQ